MFSLSEISHRMGDVFFLKQLTENQLELKNKISYEQGSTDVTFWYATILQCTQGAYPNGVPICESRLGYDVLHNPGGLQEWGKYSHLHVWIGGISHRWECYTGTSVDFQHRIRKLGGGGQETLNT